MMSFLPWFIVLAVVMGGFAFLAEKFKPKFKSRAVLNKAEANLFAKLSQHIHGPLHVFPQVSYGEFLSCKNKQKFWSINAKRADFIISDQEFNVVAVIEYQGTGHFGFSSKSKENTNRRDKVKRKALKEAKIPLYEIPHKYNDEFIQEVTRKITSDERANFNLGIEPIGQLRLGTQPLHAP
jgi:hypothetical protein